MKPIFLLTALTIGIVSLYLSQRPIRFRPPLLPGAHDNLKHAEVIPFGSVGGFGGESLTFDPNGEGPYTGVADGRILKWQGEEEGWIVFAVTSPNRNECVQAYAPELEHVCGRPLGLKFHNKTGDLYITDSYFGLHKVGPNGGLSTPLVMEAEGEPFKFANNLDIDEEEDVVYFTDSSTKYYRREFWSIALVGDYTGRFMKYNIRSKEVTVLMRGLLLPNGVALSKDGTFVLVAETLLTRIQRFWLKGPKAGTHDVFIELPIFPENIRRNSRGEFWVGSFAKKNKLVYWLVSKKLVRTLLSKFSDSIEKVQSTSKAHAVCLKFNEEGQIMEVLEDSEGETLRIIAEVVEYNGDLWMAAPFMSVIGRYKLPQSILN